MGFAFMLEALSIYARLDNLESFCFSFETFSFSFQHSMQHLTVVASNNPCVMMS